MGMRRAARPHVVLGMHLEEADRLGCFGHCRKCSGLKPTPLRGGSLEFFMGSVSVEDQLSYV